MTIHLDRLSRLQRAEDFFAFFSVDYDPRVLGVYRLRILKRFALEIAAIEEQPDAPEAERAQRYAEALKTSHAQYATRLEASTASGHAGECMPAACGGCLER